MKRIIALIVALCIVLTLIPTVCAQGSDTNTGDISEEFEFERFVPWRFVPATLDENHTDAEKATELYEFCVAVSYYFWIDNEWADSFDGYYPLDYDQESLTEVINLLTRVYDEIYRVYGYIFPESFDIDAAFSGYYIAIIEASKKAEVSSDNLRLLIQLCEEENNDSHYYNSYIWDSFIASLSKAKTLYDNQATSGKTAAFWNLYFAYNQLCAQYGEPGDVDGSGITDIIDATYLQRAVTKIGSTLNSAQKIAGYVRDSEAGYGKLEPDITDVTIIQRWCTKVPVTLYDNGIKREDMELQRWEINPYFYYKKTVWWK